MVLLGASEETTEPVRAVMRRVEISGRVGRSRLGEKTTQYRHL